MYVWRLQVMYIWCKLVNVYVTLASDVHVMYIWNVCVRDVYVWHQFVPYVLCVVYVYGVLFISAMYLILWIRIVCWFHEVCLYVYFILIQVSST